MAASEHHSELDRELVRECPSCGALGEVCYSERLRAWVCLTCHEGDQGNDWVNLADER